MTSSRTPTVLKNLNTYQATRLLDEIKTLENVNYQIAELQRVKEKLIGKIVDRTGHDREGASSYILDTYKITVTTNFIYSLDKSLYEKNRDLLLKANVVRESTKYDVVKEAVRKPMNKEAENAIAEVITIKPSKPAVKIEAAVR